ncbi:MAG: porin family protein [Verrucomicrobia bacterium]|nr:porin family protein [Verrucomicrobiota bacterium]
MKKLALCAAVLIAVSQTAGAGGLGLYGAYINSDDIDAAGYGYGAKFVGDLGEGVALELRGTFFEKLENNDTGVDIELEIIPAEAGIQLRPNIADGVELVLGAGISYFFLDTNVAEVDDELGWYASAGLEISLGDSVALFGEAVYRHLEATVKDDDLDEITEEELDIDLGGIGANVGLLLGW